MIFASEFFSDDYFQARDKFYLASKRINVDVFSFECPAKGPRGETLTVDATWVGPKDAQRVILSVSGIHGVEGFCGSGCQVSWLSSLKENALPENTAALIIHMINPFGAAWQCVETHENIDLNRNFVDFSKTLPVNILYSKLHLALTCPDRTGSKKEKAKQAQEDFIKENGFDNFVQAVAGGQYQYKNGFNFGGQQASWSNDVLQKIVQEYIPKTSKVAVIDYHTGLGEYGESMIISNQNPNSIAGKRLQSWFGDICFSQSGDVGYEPTGGFAESVSTFLPNAQVAAIVLEYGTYPIERIANAMFNSFWLTQFGDYSTKLAKDIQKETTKSFYPNEVLWHNKVINRSKQILDMTLAGFEEDIC